MARVSFAFECKCNIPAFKRSRCLHRRVSLAAAAVEPFEWTGTDEFSALGDRTDEQPLPLPVIKSRKRIVLVRHGESTWNAEGRIQGSTDFAVLSAKGQKQAASTRAMLADEDFDKLFHSPLQRAAQTADIVWGDTPGPVGELPGLREVDLYSFQGLLKAEGKERYGDEFATWQRQPAAFQIDDHFPVRELWRRASAAWHDILLDDDVASSALVVAHNAVNQALICTAVGLPPTFFRRLLQSNAASTVLDFVPRAPGQPPAVTIDRLNQAPSFSFTTDVQSAAASIPRIVFLRHAATISSEGNMLPISVDEPCSSLGEVQAMKAGEFLMDARVDSLIVSPAERAIFTASQVAKCQSLVGDRAPRLQVMDELTDISMGAFSGRAASEVQNQPLPSDAEDLDEFWQRTALAWRTIHASATQDEGSTTCVVAHAAVQAALVCHCLGLTAKDLGSFRMSTAGISVIEFPFSADIGVVRCCNYTAHLGRWAAPISRDDEADVCGIDGCF